MAGADISAARLAEIERLASQADRAVLLPAIEVAQLARAYRTGHSHLAHDQKRCLLCALGRQLAWYGDHVRDREARKKGEAGGRP